MCIIWTIIIFHEMMIREIYFIGHIDMLMNSDAFPFESHAITMQKNLSMEIFLELSCWCFGTFKKVTSFCLCNSNVFGRLHEQLAKQTWFRKWNRNVFINLKRDKFIANAIQCVHFNIHVWFYFNSFSVSQTLCVCVRVCVCEASQKSCT